MARPTTWRQSINYGIVSPTTKLVWVPLIILQPGETLVATWWTYQLTAGLFQTTDYPPGDTITVVGLGVWDGTTGSPDPINPANTDWLWWEGAIWDVAQSASTDINWWMSSHGPQQDQKAQAQRRNDTEANLTIGVAVSVDESGSREGFAQTVAATVSARCLIKLPGTSLDAALPQSAPPTALGRRHAATDPL